MTPLMRWKVNLEMRLSLVVLQFVLLANLSQFGCESASKLAASGLPPNAVRVGSGKGFIYVTPAEGRMYRVRDGKVDGIKHVSKGEMYRAIGPVEGDDPTKSFADFEYYFEPAELKKLQVPSYRN